MASWNKQSGYLKRSVGKRGEPKPTILIVCEGMRTEPRYFEAFKVSSAEVTVEGKGRNTDSLVEYAIRLKKKRKGSERYDQVWCVFDRDSFPPQQFNRALELASKNNIRVAYSNEAFELWFLLHFNYYDTAMSRAQYAEKLSELLGREYKKNDGDLYRILLSKQSIAIRNANNLLEKYVPSNPCEDKPSTTVHHLVEELNKYGIK